MTLTVHTASVDVDYFAALRLPLVQGRAFDSADEEHSIKVAVVNETLARKLWPDGTALGRRFDFRGERTVVIGVARDAKYATLDETTPPFVYFPLAQRWQPTQALLVRTAGEARESTRLIADAMRAIDPRLPAPRVTTLREATGIVLLPQRAGAIVTGALGATGLALAAVGLYGIMAFSAARRTREIGIRLALGADRSSVLRVLVRDGLVLAIAGVSVGLLLAAAATRLLAAWLFDISPLDGPTYAVMSSVFLAIATAATYLSVWRAAAADPLASLRAD